MKKWKKAVAAMCGILLFGNNYLSVSAGATGVDGKLDTDGDTKIHIIALDGESDAILLESQGHFGMVDSGEDSDYPSGADPRYPFRSGVSTEKGYEGQVISYMRSVGVTKDNFDFYLGTHPHSDHIGSADEVIYEFEPERVYIMEYRDEYISESKNLFDNLYVYDKMIQAAKDVGAVLIQNFDESAPVVPDSKPEEGESSYKSEEENGIAQEESEEDTGEKTNAEDNAEESVEGDTEEGVESDIEGEEGKENPQVTENSDDTVTEDTREYEFLSPEEIKDIYDVDPMDPNDPQAADTVPNDGAGIPVLLSDDPNSTIEEVSVNTTGNPNFMLGSMELNIVNYSDDYKTLSKPDANYFSLGVIVNANGVRTYLAGDVGNYDGDEERLAPLIGKVDILKMGHHGFASSNTSSFLSQLCPRYAVQTGRYEILSASEERVESFEELAANNKTQLFSAANYASILDALVFSLNGGEVTTNIPEDEILFVKAKGLSPIVCYKNGYRYAYTGFEEVNGKKYFFAGSSVISINRWGKFQDEWYYFGENGDALTGKQRINGSIYYLNGDGVMLTGWQKIGESWYYFKENGSASTGWQIVNGKKEFFEDDGVWVNNPGEGRWVKNNIGWWYRLSDGSYPSNRWRTIGNKKYFFDSAGYMVIGWKKEENKWYYLKSDGSMAISWQKVGSRWYYFDKLGVMQTGWSQISGKNYYFEGSGAMSTGWKMLSEKWYYFGSINDGSMKSGWQKLGNIWYYLNEKGEMQTSWQTIKGNRYFFESGGAMKTSWMHVDGIWYYFGNTNDGSMKYGWQKVGSKWYYMNTKGEMQTGLQKIYGKKYYLEQSGAMVTGWKVLDNKWYYFISDGSMKTGWQKIGTTWYFMDNDGVMKTGVQQIYGKKYYLEKNGAMANGWKYVNGKWYYFGNDSDGSMKTGWQKVGNSWYYMDGEGIMQTGWKDINKKKYYFSESGSMLTGWQCLSGKWYYFGGVNDGSMKTDWQKIGNTWYFMDANGVWLRDKKR